MRNTLLLILFFIVSLASPIFGQLSQQDSIPKKKYIKYLDVRFENGAMLSNDSELGNQLVNSSYYNGVDFRLGFRKSDPNDVYSTVYRRPYIGIGWYSSTFHNEAIGKPNALYFFITAPLAFETNKKLSFSYTAAFGLSYNFKPFDPESNPANVFIGSQRNCYLHLGFVANYHLADRWDANASLGFKHFSNGAFKKPNSGINLIPFTVGLSYRMNKEKTPTVKTFLNPYIQHDLVNITLAAGSKNYDEEDGENYMKAALSINYLRQINYKYRVGLGLDVFYSAGIQDRNPSVEASFSNTVSTAIDGTWEWNLTKRLYAPIGIGVYLNRSEKNGESKPYYERVGLRYRFAQHYTAGVTIKAHAGRADFFEWSIGYTFHKDKNRL